MASSDGMQPAMPVTMAIVVAIVAVAITSAAILHRRRHTLARLVYVASSSFVREHYAAQVFALVKDGFPDDIEDDDRDDIVGCLVGFHDEECCKWLVIPADAGTMCALALVVPYHDRLYISTVCVASCWRRQGLATILLRSASIYAKEVLNLERLSGSIALARQHNAIRLQRFYKRLGGAVEPLPPMEGGAGCERTTMRIDAPSGAVTAHGVPLPAPIERAVAPQLWMTPRQYGIIRSLPSGQAMAGQAPQAAPATRGLERTANT